MGIPWAEATTAGALMGTKTVLNELLAYVDLAKLPEGALSPRSRLMMTYALCGFANFGSLGIMIGGLRPWPPSAATRSFPWAEKPSSPERLRPVFARFGRGHAVLSAGQDPLLQNRLHLLPVVGIQREQIRPCLRRARSNRPPGTPRRSPRSSVAERLNRGRDGRTTPRPVGAVPITFTLRSGRYFLRMRMSRHMSPLQNVVRRSRSGRCGGIRGNSRESVSSIVTCSASLY